MLYMEKGRPDSLHSVYYEHLFPFAKIFTTLLINSLSFENIFDILANLFSKSSAAVYWKEKSNMQVCINQNSSRDCQLCQGSCV